MNLNILRWRSLKTRATLITLAIFLISIWSLSFYACRMLREDMQRLLSDQQFSTISLIAADINEELDSQLRALETVAERVSPAMLGNSAALQAHLEEHQVFQRVFNGGTFATRIDGTAIADTPLSAGRIGVNFMDRDYIVAALKEGKAMIGRPVKGRVRLAPVFAMAAPIRDPQGKVVGALAGVTNLDEPNFLDKITGNSYGKTGGYLLIAPQYRLVVTATDKSRILGALPAPGISPPIDRFIQGYEGSAVFVNPLGVEVLTSGKGVPVAGWIMSAVLPTAEAFAPIRVMQQRLLLASIFLTLLAVTLTWWLLRRQLTLLLAAVEKLAVISNAGKPLQPLPVTDQDEIGQLVGGFNRLLETLAQREEALNASESRSRAIIEASPVPLAINDGHGHITYLNKAFVQTIGYTANDIPTLADWWPRAYPDPQYRQRVADNWQKSMEEAKRTSTPFVPMELNIRCKDDAVRTFMASAAPLHERFAGTHLIILYDITERKQMEKAQEEALSRLRKIASQVPGVVFQFRLRADGSSCVPYANEALREIYRVSPDEVRDDAAPIISAVHPDDLPGYLASVETSAKNLTTWHHEYRLKFEGEPDIWLLGQAIPQQEADGSVLWHGFVTDITEHKGAADLIAHLAQHDALTGLLNRSSLMERLEQVLATARREHRLLAVMFLDMDRFKKVNDTLGHAIGDGLLVEVARRLGDVVRNSDIVARLGGDEFVVVLTEVENAPSAARVAEKILKSLAQSYFINEHEVQSTPSIGLAFFPTDGDDSETLMKNADTAMYHAKSQGRNNLQFFTPEMNAFAMKRLRLESDLRVALATGQFELHYQPQLDAKTGRFVGVEALLRWRNPQEGLVLPAGFIQVAEETGMILPLGEWVLDEACRQLSDWRGQGFSNVSMAVNLSARQLRSPTLLTFVALTLEKHGLTGADLELEITESTVMDDPKACIGKLKALRKMGVRLSIDDFGTGYSSLSYLKLMPIHSLKVDQSFVRDIETDANDVVICTATIALAHNLGLKVVAEGVETEAQRNFLTTHHCDFLQGFLFSKPVGATAATAFFNERKH